MTSKFGLTVCVILLALWLSWMALPETQAEIPGDLSHNKGQVTLEDYAILASQWLWCNNPEDQDCIVPSEEVVVLDCDFESLPLGSISTEENGGSVGDVGTATGQWRSVGTWLEDPSIVDTFSRSGSRSYRLSRSPAGQIGIGWTTAKSVYASAGFMLSFWVNRAASGSWIVTVNNCDVVQSNLAVAVYIDSYGNLYAREKKFI